MNTTFAMWRKSLSQLIMMKDKKEWDELDIFQNGLLLHAPRLAQLPSIQA